MSLDSYSSLITTLQAWLAKAEVAGDAPDCIALFEAWVNRNLRVPQMEQEAIAPASEYMELPGDYLALRDIQWQGNPRVQLEYMTPQQADAYDRTGAAGTPHYYTIVGDQLRLIRAPDSQTNVRIAYWRRIAPLSAGNPSNWLLDLYPDAYLYGALVHGRVRMNDVATASAINNAWQGIARELQDAGRTANVGSLLRIRTF